MSFRDHGAKPRVHPGASVRFPLFATALCVWLACVLLVFRDLPMVDLPQHAAQLTTWLNWRDPSYSSGLELNLRTPYLLAYCVAFPIASVLGVVLAWKLVVLLAVVSSFLSILALARRLGHSPWIALLGLPGALGYSFYYGFISFLLALPLAVLAVVAALAHAERPRLTSGAALCVVSCLVLFAHGVLFAMAMCAAAPLLTRGQGSLIARGAPLLAPLLLGFVWLGPGSSLARMGVDIWEGGLSRLANLPGALVGVTSRDAVAAAFGLGLLLTLGLSVGEPEKRIERWAALAMVFAGYCFFPRQLRGYGFISERFASFLLPAVLLAFAPRSKEPHSLVRWMPALLTFAWLGLFTIRLQSFNQETAGFYRLLERIPAGLQLRALVFDRESRAFPGMPLFLHLPSYYLVEKGGRLAHSFAVYPNSVIRFQPGVSPEIRHGAEWKPLEFDIREEALRHGYYVVKSAVDRGSQLFAGTPVPIVFDAREGDFWGYRVGP